MKHNKKRNTAFVFESLVKEITVAIMKGDAERKNKTVAIVKRHFTSDSMLRKHLDCYKSRASQKRHVKRFFRKPK